MGSGPLDPEAPPAPGSGVVELLRTPARPSLSVASVAEEDQVEEAVGDHPHDEVDHLATFSSCGRTLRRRSSLLLRRGSNGSTPAVSHPINEGSRRQGRAPGGAHQTATEDG
jgi:hypothetical protein